MKLLSALFLMLFCLELNAQEHSWNLFPGKEDSIQNSSNSGKITGFNLDFNAKPGEVKVNQDSREEKLIQSLSEIPAGATGPRIKGYRVQLFFDADKDAVNQKRADYMAHYRNNAVYIDYQQPNFRLRAGNYRTRLQAQRCQDEVKIEFPDAIVVEDMIDLPELRDE